MALTSDFRMLTYNVSELSSDYNMYNAESTIEPECINVSAFHAAKYQYQTGQIMLVTVILPLIFFIGMTGNIAFIYVAFRVKHMRTITNRYLVNLSVADCLFLTAAIGDKVWKYIKSPILGDTTPLGPFGCIWVYFISDTAYFASLIFITIVSLDRYIAVCRPQDRRNLMKSRSQMVIAITWIVAGVLSACLIPANATFAVYCFAWPEIEPFITWSSTVSVCLAVKEWVADFATGLQTVPFFISLVLNTYLYRGIIHGMDQSIKRMSQHGVKRNTDRRTRTQIAHMLVANGIIFFCLLAPFELGSLFQIVASIRGGTDYNYLISNNAIRSFMMLLARILSYTNSAINPLVYTAMCRRYREAFKNALVPDAFQCNLTESQSKTSNMSLQMTVHAAEKGKLEEETLATQL